MNQIGEVFLMEQISREIAKLLVGAAPPGVGVVVLTFNRRAITEQAFASNVPEDPALVLAALDRLVENLRVRQLTTKKIGGGQ